MTMGKCRHGEFVLTEGCSQCTAERMAEITSEGQVVERAKLPDAEEIREEPVAEVTVEIKDGEVVETEHTLTSEMADKGEPAPATKIKKVEDLVAETALALRPGEDVETTSYYFDAVKLQEYAEARVIATVEDVKVANDDLNIIAKLKKAMEAKKREYLDPLKAQSDSIRATYDYLMTPVIQADRLTRDKMLSFTKEQERKRQEAEAIKREQEELAARAKALNGEVLPVVEVVEVEEAPKTVSTAMGASGLTDHWIWEVVDPLLIPREYLVVDEAQLSAIAKSHHDKKPIPGVRFYNEPIIARRRR